MENSLLKIEIAALQEFLERIFGYHLLQLGGPARSDFLEASPIEHKIYFNTEYNTTVQGKFDELPFLPNSIDLVIAAHILESVKDPKKILNEIYHILIPDGSVIITGSNLFSLWGFITSMRIRHWLSQLGFKIIKQKTLSRGIYILEAKKTVTTLTPIKVKRSLVKQRAIVPSPYVKPTNRVHNEKS
jgi:SAM-dependent methyltransferase